MKSESVIVISGISGRYPESDNLESLWSNLLNGIEMCKLDDRIFAPVLREDSPRVGKLRDLHLFDAEFFQIPDDIANQMSSFTRKTIEVVYEAIYDSGFLLTDWKHAKNCLFFANCSNNEERDHSARQDFSNKNLDNILAYVCSVFDIKGGAISVDTGSASSGTALDRAIKSIAIGDCDNAIVAGCNPLNYHESSRYYRDLNMTSKDGLSKSLDASANGFCQSESIVAIIVQRKCYAKRIYATILGSKMNCDGYKPEGILFPEQKTQAKLFESLLKDLSLDPIKIDYIEGHLTGTQAGDPVECASIQKAYRPDSVKPLYLGCLKSNIGHGMATAFLNAVSKVIKIFQTGLIPANNNYNKPNPRIPGLIKGILVPVLENKSFDGNLIPIHGLGFGGVNVVAILKANSKRVTEQDKILSCSGIPRLIQFCSINYKGLEAMVNFIKENERSLTKYTLALINDLSKADPYSGLNYRGYALLDDHQSIIVRELCKVKENSKPWFVFNPIFETQFEQYQQLILLANIAHRLQSLNYQTMKSLGLDIIEIINKNQNDFTSRLVVSIAMQIVLHDFLSKDLNIVPEVIVGHSLGSIAAAYADGCLSDEQAVSIAYHIGIVCSSEFNERPGSIVKIALPCEQITNMKYEAVDIASVESNNCTIISGSKESIESFLYKLDDEVKREKISTNDIPFHSSYFCNATRTLRRCLTQVNLEEVYASNKLLFTSDQRPEVKKRPINADFFIDLLKSSCDLHHINQDSSLGSLKIAIGNEKSSNIDSIALLGNGSVKKPINTLLESIGKLYLSGLNPTIENLYETVKYPVPRETQSLSQLIKWNHDKKWNIPSYSEFIISKRFKLSEYVNLNEQDYAFITGHKVDNRILFPAAGYLYLAWKMIYAKHNLSDPKQYAIELNNVRLHNAIYFGSSSMKADIAMKVNNDTKSFIMFNGDERNICVTGNYRLVSKPSIDIEFNRQLDVPPSTIDGERVLHSKDVYKELRIRGYDYSGSFKGIHKASSTGNWGLINDTEHWITFADSCLQVSILAEKRRKLFVPVSINYVYINPSETYTAFEQNKRSGHDSGSKLMMQFDASTGLGFTQGFMIQGLAFKELRRSLQVTGTKREYRFFEPFESVIVMDIRLEQQRCEYISHLASCIEIVYENFSQSDLYKRCKVVNNFASSGNHESYVLLKFLCENIQRSDNTNIGKAKLRLEYACQNLLHDVLFLEPLKLLMQRSIGFISEYFAKDEINSIAFNFLAIPSEVSLNNEKLFCSLNMKVNYAIANNYRDLVTHKSTTLFYNTDLAENKQIIPFHQFELIFVRDASTYLPMIAPKALPEFDMKTAMKAVYNSLKEGGFCIIVTRTHLTRIENEFYKLLGASYDIHFDKEAFKLICKEIGFSWIGFKYLELEGYCSILLRRPIISNLRQEHSIIRVGLDNFDWIDKIKEAHETENHKIWLIGGGHDNGIIGLTRSLHSDPYEYNVRCYYDPSKADHEEIIIPDDILSKDCLINIVDDKGSGLVGTYIYSNTGNLDQFQVETSHCYVDVQTPGDLSSLRLFQAYHSKWTEFPRSKLKKDCELVNIYYGALNFRDIMISTKRILDNAYPENESEYPKSSIGSEFSGIDSKGNRIMGFCETGSLSSSLVIDQKCIKFCVPNEWTLSEAATVPIVYLTAYYGLICRGNLQKDETVLIHAGSGGVGQAAINICLNRNCKVFTTVGTTAKREYIKRRFPSIDDEHIGDSRSTSFEEMILKMTNGRGVDLVLNSLSDDKFAASLRCLADFGRFIEIGKYDITQNILLDNILMETNKSFHACCLPHLLMDVKVIKNAERVKLWNDLIEIFDLGIKSGEVKPLQTTIFEVDQLEEAFRYMATGKHIGKILIRLKNEQELAQKTYKAIGQTFFNLDKVYVITGGLGGLGLELAYWMRQRGATNFVISSRNGIQNPYQEHMIDKITRNSETYVNIVISNEDCHTYDSAERLMKKAAGMGIIGGIFHLAMVLKDSFFENQTVESFLTAVNPKAFASRNLDNLSRLLPYKLDYFVCFSSVSSLIGFLGQSNYSFGNSSMEQICLKRISDGLHALAIQLGVIGDVGAIADLDISSSYNLRHLKAMRLPLFFQTLDKLLLNSYSVCLVAITDEKYTSIKSIDESLRRTIFNIIGIEDDANVYPDSTLRELGIDSLMAFEIQQCLETKYEYSLTTKMIRELHVYDLSAIEQNQQRKIQKL